MREGEPSFTSTLVALGRAYAPRDRDPYPERLASDPWRTIAAAGSRPVLRRVVRELSIGFVDHLALRTATLDTFVRAATTEGIAQVVLLGAGLDARAWRLHVDARFFEIDHPSTQRLKRERAEALGTGPHRGSSSRGEGAGDDRAGDAARAPSTAITFVPVDFTRDDLGRALEAAGHDADAPTAWIWEGVTMYLPRSAVDATLTIVSIRSASGSRLASTYLDPSAVPLAPFVRVGFRALFGEPLDAGYSAAEMRALLDHHRFDVTFDDDSRGWDRAMGGDPRRARLVRGERMVIARRR